MSDEYLYYDEEQLEMFWHWINERHGIYFERQRGESWPWTDDEILQTYKFTNVFRELDRVTVWIKKQFRQPLVDMEVDADIIFFNMAMCRYFNWPDTLDRIGIIHDWDPKEVESVLRDMEEDDKKIFTGAYMLTGMLGGDKITQAVWKVLDPLWWKRQEVAPRQGDTLQEAFEKIAKGNPGYGPFLAYEIVSDLRWTPALWEAEDILTWANAGPGAMRGVNRLLGIPVGWHPTKKRKSGRRAKWPVKVLSPEEYVDCMRDLLEMKDEYLGSIFHHYDTPPFEMREIEHSLCEFDKYMRVKLGQGRPRAKFTPPHER